MRQCVLPTTKITCREDHKLHVTQIVSDMERKTMKGRLGGKVENMQCNKDNNEVESKQHIEASNKEKKEGKHETMRGVGNEDHVAGPEA